MTSMKKKTNIEYQITYLSPVDLVFLPHMMRTSVYVRVWVISYAYEQNVPGKDLKILPD